MTTRMQRPWTDTSKSGKERIALLVAEMTLEEKMGQLGSIWYEFALFSPAGEDKEESLVDNVPIFEKVAQPLTWEAATKDGLGQFTRPFGTKPIAAADGARKIIEWQKRLVKETRLGIPAIVHEECLTGFTTLGATSFPTPLGLAATFDEKVIEKVSAAMGADMKSVGVHQGLSPVLDTVRDYRWGRVEETMGEDPYLSAVAGTAYVKGLQSAGIIATLKHFFGHSSSRAARNHGPVSMGWREMYDFMLPPFEMAIREGGVKSVMNSYTDVDGLPCAADPKIFTTILRDELNFDGTVVSDYWAISFLEVMHRVAENEADAGALSLIAGIDVELPATRCYSDGLLALIRAGKVDEKYLDRALVRVLNHKLELGLLDADWTPERDVTADLGTVNFDSASNRAVALEAARESVILLSNKDSFLPITNAPKNIVVVGPCGDDGGAFLGCYSFANHVMAMTPGSGLGIEVPSIKSAIATAFKGTDVSSVVGCPVKDFDTSAIPAARSAVDSADLAIVVVGDRAGLFGRGTSGEGNDVADLTLPGAQGQLLDACLNSNTPVIVVSVSGRPYAMGAYADRAKAMIQAFMPGEEGGTAIAEVINGTISPSGRLPVEIPTNVSGQPSTYLHPKYGQPGLNISPVDSIPLFTFGHGLTYTTFKYSELTLSTNEISTDGKLTASCSITNTGTREGTEVVQLYFEDPVAEVARPIITLLGFARITLAHGETKKITFDIHSDRFAYMGADVVRIMDAGELILKLGSSSSDIKSSKSLTVTGSKRVVPHNRVLRTPVSIG